MTSAVHAKMAALFKICRKAEQRSSVHFLVSMSNKPIEIHRHMKLQYSEAYLAVQMVYESRRKFKNGVSSVTNITRLQATAEDERVSKEYYRVKVELSSGLIGHK